jgi:hypothetical protein
MNTPFDEYYVDLVRSMLSDVSQKLIRAQSYAAEAGFDESTYPQKDIKKLLNATNRLNNNLIFYMVKSQE